MDFDFSLRDIVIVVIGLVGVYIAVMVLRLSRLRRQQADVETEEDYAEPGAGEDGEEAIEEDIVYSRPQRRAEPLQSSDFSAELARSQLEPEVRALREEVAQLREELTRLRTDMNDVRAARHISPQYSEAMTLAQRGLTAQDVADRCGISLGEAELVWSLSRGPNFEEEEEAYGGERRAYARSA